MVDKELYNVSKMQKEEAEELVFEEEERIKRNNTFHDEANQALKASDKTLSENLAWLKTKGLSLDTESQDTRQKANQETNVWLEELNKAKPTVTPQSVSYDELVKAAHSKGYVNTELQELLTDAEIRIADERFESIEKDFQSKTQLSKGDTFFLITALALQVVRQYVITPFSDKVTAEEGASIMEKRYGRSGKLKGQYYYATEETILTQPKVPFDIIAGSKKYRIGRDGKGLDGKSHRFRSLGHDPILGYLFGTANIVTNTTTWWDFTSHHIKYKKNIDGTRIPTIAAHANTGKVFKEVEKRFNAENGRRILVEAIAKEHLHLKSDVTTAGLPLPFLQTLSLDFTQTLAEAGFDATALGDIVKQGAGAELINFLIATIHGLLCEESGEKDQKLYRVRTKKIILISNVIASSSNLIAVGIGAGVGASGQNPEAVKQSLKYLDLGGLLVTIVHLLSDLRFITKVKEEFINSKLDGQLIGVLNDIDRYLVD